MRANQLALLALVLSACPPPPPGPCTRDVVDENGFISSTGGGPIFIFDAGSAGDGRPLGALGQPFRLKIFAPQTGCERDRISARVQLLGPDNFAVPGATLSEPVRDSTTNVVSTEVVFTPVLPGQHLLQVFFEPSLGMRSLLLDVADQRLTPPSVRVAVPNVNQCEGQVWPVSADTVACERSTGVVELFSSDGGMTSFSGLKLVVAGPALWSLETSGALKRRVFEDGGLTVTNVFGGFSTDRTVQGMHDEHSALRALIDGELVVASSDGGVLDLNRNTNSVGGQVLFTDGAELFTETACNFTGCVGLVGLEPGVRWSTSFGGGIEGDERPVKTDGGTPDVTLDRTPELLQPPERGFERLPLWLPVPGDDLAALVNGERASLGLSVWKRSQVIRVGRDFVVLKDQGDAVRVTPR